MSRKKINLNTVYVPDRLKDELQNISICPLTTVVAPMGYGKTTLINWYLGECSANDYACVIRINIYSDNLAIFWKSAQDAFAHVGLDFLMEYSCPEDATSGSLVTEAICNALSVDKSIYIFIDDFHLLTDETASTFLCAFTNRLPENVHLIIAGRDSFMHSAEIVRLGSKIYQIGADELRLTCDEISQYTHLCGIFMSEEELQQLFYASEGWYTAVYLNLNTFTKQGKLPDRNSDIYAMFTAAMIDTLPEQQREFLAVMGFADEFNLAMASFITENPDAESILTILTEQNAFIKKLPDGATYRFHHMMRECAEQTFLTLDSDKQIRYRNRYGAWYESHGQYIHAMTAYRHNYNFHDLLRVVEKDAGILLSYIKPASVLRAIDMCPDEIKMAHPAALLVLMRCMFNWRNIPKMMEIKELILKSIEINKEMSPEEKGNLLGESDLVTSFLMYNDISAMSSLHRSASAQMTRPAISISNTAGWTFGSPSVLMMFYRKPGALLSELKEMDECMPHYYKVTNNHGWGAEAIMRAEASFAQGKLEDAQIELERAYAMLDQFRQENMLLCCDFLAHRLSNLLDIKLRCSLDDRYKELVDYHNASFINIWKGISAYAYALRMETSEIPPAYAEDRTDTMNVLAPGKPMVDMILNQVFLAQGDYAKVVGRSQAILGMCEGLHYKLVALHVMIQTASAYWMLDKKVEAFNYINNAFDIALPDGLVMPFVECYPYVKELLSEDILPSDQKQFIEHIHDLGLSFESRIKEELRNSDRVQTFTELTARENEIASLMAKRLTNREIAEKLFLSEGSVKQYSNQIYCKLHIEGATRTKRKRLIELLEIVGVVEVGGAKTDTGL